MKSAGGYDVSSLADSLLRQRGVEAPVGQRISEGGSAPLEAERMGLDHSHADEDRPVRSGRRLCMRGPASGGGAAVASRQLEQRPFEACPVGRILMLIRGFER